jgi:hypothetical protein
MPKGNGYRRRQAPTVGSVAVRCPDLLLDNDFVAPKKEDRTDQRAIEATFDPDRGEWSLTLSAGDKDQ